MGRICNPLRFGPWDLRITVSQFFDTLPCNAVDDTVMSGRVVRCLACHRDLKTVGRSMTLKAQHRENDGWKERLHSAAREGWIKGGREAGGGSQ